MVEHIRNIYCVGRNYRLHAEELGNAVPDQPMLFMKPTHSIVWMNGQSVELPATRGSVHYEAELVLHVGRHYEAGIRVDDLVDKMTLGLDLTLRDVQSELKQKGHPWLAAKGFLNSALVGEFHPFPGIDAVANTDFTLHRNGQEVQRGNITNMIFDLQTMIDFCAENYGLGRGDLIYTGTPQGVGEVLDGDRFELFWGEDLIGSSVMKLYASGH